MNKIIQAAEWAPHDSCWLAWPWDQSLWQENLEAAQKEFVELCQGIAAGEALHILVPNEAFEVAARKALVTDAKIAQITLHRIPVGDIWLRDTAPIFVHNAQGKVEACSFQFNGWGEKYLLEHDDQVSIRVSEASGLPVRRFPFVLEGGSVEVDGEGTVLTTRQCLLNPNRNPDMTLEHIEKALAESLGARKVLWLQDGLLNDHTDDHIDTIARFVAPGKVVCMEATTPNDPNCEVLEKIATDLNAMTDAQGRRLEVIRIPSPGLIEDEDGEIMPASYVNFYIGNATVVVPTYGVPQDQSAVAAIAKCFPLHRTLGASAKAILSGGGAFHCITQQQPSPVKG